MGRGDAFVHDAADTLRGWVREAGGFLVVDGAMGTELEAHGADLQDELWSARCLVSAPHLIRKVHLDYLEAGGNVITTASYQVRHAQSARASRPPLPVEAIPS
jgi:homocysteine S-methyltransferase